MPTSGKNSLQNRYPTHREILVVVISLSSVLELSMVPTPFVSSKGEDVLLLSTPLL